LIIFSARNARPDLAHALRKSDEALNVGEDLEEHPDNEDYEVFSFNNIEALDEANRLHLLTVSPTRSINSTPIQSPDSSPKN